MLRKTYGSEHGASLVEYAAVIVLVAAVAVVVLVSGVPRLLGDGYESAICRIFGGQECAEVQAPSADSPSGTELPPGGESPQALPRGEGTDVPSEDPPQDPFRAEPVINTTSTWPYADSIVPVNNADPHRGGEDIRRSGAVPADESPFYEPPGPYPQQDAVDESTQDFKEKGEGEAKLYCFFWESMCCPENTCNTLEQVADVIFLAELCRFGLPCLPHSADHLKHYITGNGEDKVIDMEQFMSDVPEFAEVVDERQRTIGEQAIEEAKRMGADRPVIFPVSTAKTGWGYPPDAVNGSSFVYDNRDWQNAIGSFHYHLVGEVTAIPPTSPGGEWTYTVTTEVKMEKYYDWERDNDSPALSGRKSWIYNFSQQDLARLHQYGMAQEYWVKGETRVTRKG